MNLNLENRFRNMLNDDTLPVSENKTQSANETFKISSPKKKTNVIWLLVTFSIIAVLGTQIPKTWWTQTFGVIFGIKQIKNNDDKSSNDVNQEDDSDNEEYTVNEEVTTVQELEPLPLTPGEIEDENFQAIESN